MRPFFLTLLGSLLIAGAARASVDVTLAHSGYLLDASDNPVSGVRTMSFTLYETASSAQPIWSSGACAVTVDGGFYSVVLGGDGCGTGLTSAHVAHGSPRHLLVTVDSVPMQPRLEVSALPVARVARHAEHVLDGGVTTASVQDGAVTLAKLAVDQNGHLAGLSADLLDGLDSTAFAPASITGDVAAIAASVGTGLGAKVDTLTARLGTPAAGQSVVSRLEAANAALSSIAQNTASLGSGIAALEAGHSSLASGQTSLQNALSQLRSDVTALDGKTGSLEALMGVVANDTGAIRNDALTLKTDTQALRNAVGTPSVSLAATLAARGRYSESCDPTTDTWLAQAYPGLTPTQVFHECLSDGRWHRIGTAMDLMRGTKSVPHGFEVAVTNYSSQLHTGTVNGWNWGWRFCYGPVAIGDAGVITEPIIQCITVDDGSHTGQRRFIVTHKHFHTTAYASITRSYDAAFNDIGCTQQHEGLTAAHCGNSEAQPSFWNIWVRR